MPNKDRNIPKRRFKAFENADAWELRKLVNEVLFIGTGKSKFSALEFGEFEILGSTSVIGYDNSYDYEGDFILTARVGTNAGELYRHSGKVKISDNTVFIQGDLLDFIFYILQHFDIKKLSFGTGQPLVKASELKGLKIIMPVSVKERNHVGTFFSTLDQQITLHQRKSI
ncbi:restriction endonuclease subunit S [Streptococcus suis]|uniref:restriction endonuclease subunit S n=1 Tax=Streptococcus suis TaxID=1307 RepID=UPI000C1A83E7|nr:restriction endonuclease subunit S [Streptococcus suis]